MANAAQPPRHRSGALGNRQWDRWDRRLADRSVGLAPHRRTGATEPAGNGAAPCGLPRLRCERNRTDLADEHRRGGTSAGRSVSGFVPLAWSFSTPGMAGLELSPLATDVLVNSGENPI